MKELQINSARHNFQISKFCSRSFLFKQNNKNLHHLVGLPWVIPNEILLFSLCLLLTTIISKPVAFNCVFQSEVESRTQGSRPRPRPRTQKKSEAKAKDSLSEDRHSRGQGQECSRPRTKDTKRKCSPKKKKKKGLHKNFSGDLQ